jgi:integrase
MPTLNRIPKYRKHRASGQAIVTLDGRDFYLGPHGTAASRAEYDRRVSEWIAAGRRLPADPASVTVAELVAAFRKHARDYYRDADGNVSRAVVNFDDALRPVLKLYGKTPAVEFGPLRLKAVREQMIAAGRVRTNINRHVARVRHVFKWAVENEVIPGSVAHGLAAVGGLRVGRSGAVEGEAVKPVALAHVEAVRPHVSAQVWGMIQLQLLTGMRPGEVVLMRGCDLDTTGALWTFSPAKHKGQVHGHTRVIYVGPKSQEVIRPFLKTDLQAYLYSPADAERDRRERLHALRLTPLSCGNKPGNNRCRRPTRTAGERYTVASYYRAVVRACDAAFPVPDEIASDAEKVTAWRKEHRWHVHQLRHRAATDLRKQYGVEVAQVMLGHTKIETAQIYAEKNSQLAQRVAMEVG